MISSYDIRQNPERMLTKLCTAIGLRFAPEMLRWPAGPKPFDGVWAPHWYDAVHSSVGFASAEPDLPELSGDQIELLQDVMPAYAEMASAKLSFD